MSPSSAFSHRRQILRRPKICLPPPPPPPPPPVACTCSINKFDFDGIDQISCGVAACKTALPPEEEVECQVTVDPYLEPITEDNPLNCLGDAARAWLGADEGTPYTFTAVFTFSDSSICTEIANYTP